MVGVSGSAARRHPDAEPRTTGDIPAQTAIVSGLRVEVKNLEIHDSGEIALHHAKAKAGVLIGSHNCLASPVCPVHAEEGWARTGVKMTSGRGKRKGCGGSRPGR